MPRTSEIGYTQPCINCRGKSATHFAYFWSRKTLPYTHLEATSYIPQQGQSLHSWTTSISNKGCYKNKYTIQFLWMACISRFSTAILSGETELAFGTIRVNNKVICYKYQALSRSMMPPPPLSLHLSLSLTTLSVFMSFSVCLSHPAYNVGQRFAKCVPRNPEVS